MMEEGGEALGFAPEICWLSEQAEMWLDRIRHAITEPAHVDRLHSPAGRHRAEGKRESLCFVEANRAAKIKAGSPP